MKTVKNHTMKNVQSVWASGYTTSITLIVNGQNETLNLELTLEQAESIVQTITKRLKTVKENILEELKEKNVEA